MSSRDRSLAERARELERGRAKRYAPDKPKKWLRTICPNCGAKVEYQPLPHFAGELYCGNCGEKFHLTRLDEFTEEEEPS